MNYHIAMVLVNHYEKKLARDTWDPTQWVCLHNGYIAIQKGTEVMVFEPSQEDILAEDWGIVWPVYTVVQNQAGQEFSIPELFAEEWEKKFAAKASDDQPSWVRKWSLEKRQYI